MAVSFQTKAVSKVAPEPTAFLPWDAAKPDGPASRKAAAEKKRNAEYAQRRAQTKKEAIVNVAVFVPLTILFITGIVLTIYFAYERLGPPRAEYDLATISGAEYDAKISFFKASVKVSITLTNVNLVTTRVLSKATAKAYFAPIPGLVLKNGNSAYWEIMDGKQYCQLTGGEGQCVTDGDGNYGPLEKCRVRAVHPLVVSAVQYDVEERQDYVTVKGVAYRDPIRPPRNIDMKVDDYIHWESDVTDVARKFEGFTLCAARIPGIQRSRQPFDYYLGKFKQDQGEGAVIDRDKSVTLKMTARLEHTAIDEGVIPFIEVFNMACRTHRKVPITFVFDKLAVSDTHKVVPAVNVTWQVPCHPSGSPWKQKKRMTRCCLARLP